jgi:hypothetical protein
VWEAEWVESAVVAEGGGGWVFCRVWFGGYVGSLVDICGEAGGSSVFGVCEAEWVEVSVVTEGGGS